MSSPALKSVPKQEAPAQAPAAAPPVQQQAAQPPAAPKKSSPVRRIILGGIALIALGFAIDYGYGYLTVGRFQVSTDDAYVKADTSILSNKIPGLVVETPVKTNTPVKAGDVVLRLEAEDYKLALAAVQAKIETQKAALEVIAAQKVAQQAAITSAIAQLDSAKATEVNAALTQQRASQLLKSAVGSQQALDDANRAHEAALAGVTSAQASVDVAKAQLATLDANEKQANSALAELQVALEKAQNDLAGTEIRAPFDGVVSNRSVAPGEYLSPGTNLMALVPVQQSFVVANFKETQMAMLHPGQKVEIEVDSFKGEKFEGTVASLSPASGAEFSLLPPDNATGNFTKITQRFPVKILLPPEVSLRLRPGMSVTASVDYRDKGADAGQN